MKTACYALIVLLIGLSPAFAGQTPNPETIITNTSTVEAVSAGPGTIVNNYGTIRSEAIDGGVAINMIGPGTVNNSGIISGAKHGIKSYNEDEGDVFIHNERGAVIEATGNCGDCAINYNAAIQIERRSRNVYIFNRGTIQSADNLAIRSRNAKDLVIIANEHGGVINGDIVVRKTIAFLVLDDASIFNGNVDMRRNILSQVILRGVHGATLDQTIIGAQFLSKEDPGTWTIDQNMTFSNSVYIMEGTLVVNGTITVPDVYISTNGGHLEGTGSIIGTHHYVNW